jgi:hypothetical protein
MSGHVFHPGHEELHGITVVVESRAGTTYVGRYHETAPNGVVLHDVAMHDVTSAMAQSAWLERQRKFGVEAKHKHVVVPTAEVVQVTRLSK